MSKPKRLHPIAILIHTFNKMKDFFVPLIGLFFVGLRENGGIWIILAAAIVSTLFAFTASFLSWLRHTYQLDEKELRIEYGVFIRKKRYIPYERIQSLDISEGLLQRIFGLVKVQIETAGGRPHDGAEAMLSSISRKEARSIEEFLAAKQAGQMISDLENQKSPFYQITLSQLMLMAFTSGGTGVAVSAFFAFLSHVSDYVPFKKLYGGAEKMFTASLLLAVILIFLGFLTAWIIAFLGIILKYAHFTVNKTEHDLVISQGLWERRQITIPLKRIQAVWIRENLLRQLLGLATVYIESAGGSAQNKEGSRVMLLPIVKIEDAAEFLQPLLTDYKITNAFHPLPKRAMLRYMIRAWYVMLPIVLVSFLVFKAWGSLSLILAGIVTFWAFLKYRDCGWSQEKCQLNFRFRTLNRHTVFMKKNRIQSLKIRESYFQRKRELATVEAFIKAGFRIAGGTVTDIDRNDMERIFAWYSSKKEEDR